METLIKILYFFAGVDRDAIKSAQNKERNGYLILGAVVLVPSIMAWFGMYHQIYWVGYVGLYRIGICTMWSIIILAIDILMINTMYRPENIFNKENWKVSSIFFGKAIFRLSVSILLGYYISQPLILKNYGPEINAELDNIKKERLDSLAYNNEAKKIHFTLNDSTRLKELKDKQNCLEFLLSCELCGKDTILSCGYTSKFFGKGHRYDTLDKRITDVKKEIHSLDSTIKKVIWEKDAANKILTDSIEKNYSKGYAIRQQALDNIEKKPGGNNVANRHLWLLLLLIFLDSVAVLMKIFMPYGVHDRKLDERKNKISGEILVSKNKVNKEILVSTSKDDKIAAVKITAINNDAASYSDPDVNNRLDNLKRHIYEIINIWNYERTLNETLEDIQTADIKTDGVQISGRSKNIIIAILSFVFLLIIVYKLQANDISWFATWGTIFSILYMIFIELYKSLFNH